MSFFYYYCWMAMNIFCGLFQFYLIDTVKKGRESAKGPWVGLKAGLDSLSCMACGCPLNTLS